MNHIIAKPLSRKNIVSCVQAIRRATGLEKELYFPVLRFAELVLPRVDQQFVFEVVETKELYDKYACYNPSTNTMTVREDVYNDAYNNDGRHRFTIAHELGHYFLHKNSVILPRANNSGKVVSYMDPEWQANTFASELLMPNQLIRNLSVDEVQRKCCTSFEASWIALKKAKKPSA